MKQRRNDESDRAQEKERGAQLGRRPVEDLLAEFQAAEQRAQPEDEEDVPDDRARERRLHQVVQARPEGEDRDDEFRGVPERRVQQPSETGAHVLGKHLGGFPHDPGEGNDRDRGGKKERGSRRVEDVLENQRDGNEDQKKQESLVRFQLESQPILLPFSPESMAAGKAARKKAPSGFEPE